jgi:hypothetical protein
VDIHSSRFFSQIFKFKALILVMWLKVRFVLWLFAIVISLVSRHLHFWRTLPMSFSIGMALN